MQMLDIQGWKLYGVPFVPNKIPCGIHFPYRNLWNSQWEFTEIPSRWLDAAVVKVSKYPLIDHTFCNFLSWAFTKSVFQRRLDLTYIYINHMTSVHHQKNAICESSCKVAKMFASVSYGQIVGQGVWSTMYITVINWGGYMANANNRDLRLRVLHHRPRTILELLLGTISQKLQ